MSEPRSTYRTLAADAERNVPTAALLLALRYAGLPAPEQEYRFDAERKWSFDLAWPALRLAVEINGGAWTNGRHTRGQGYINDLEKLNRAQLAGWLVLQFTPEQAMDGTALAVIEQAIRTKGGM
jgi:hypothetical protein